MTDHGGSPKKHRLINAWLAAGPEGKTTDVSDVAGASRGYASDIRRALESEGDALDDEAVQDAHDPDLVAEYRDELGDDAVEGEWSFDLEPAGGQEETAGDDREETASSDREDTPEIDQEDTSGIDRDTDRDPSTTETSEGPSRGDQPVGPPTPASGQTSGSEGGDRQGGGGGEHPTQPQEGGHTHPTRQPPQQPESTRGQQQAKHQSQQSQTQPRPPQSGSRQPPRGQPPGGQPSGGQPSGGQPSGGQPSGQGPQRRQQRQHPPQQSGGGGQRQPGARQPGADQPHPQSPQQQPPQQGQPPTQQQSPGARLSQPSPDQRPANVAADLSGLDRALADQQQRAEQEVRSLPPDSRARSIALSKHNLIVEVRQSLNDILGRM